MAAGGQRHPQRAGDVAVDHAGNLYIADMLNSRSARSSASRSRNAAIAPAAWSAPAPSANSLPCAGSWIEIYGSNLASTTLGWSGADFNGIDAPTKLSPPASPSPDNRLRRFHQPRKSTSRFPPASLPDRSR